MDELTEEVLEIKRDRQERKYNRENIGMVEIFPDVNQEKIWKGEDNGRQ